MSNQYDSIRHTKCLHILCNWNRFLLIGFRILATSKDYVKINFLPQYQLVEFNKSTSSTDKSVTSHAKSLVKKNTGCLLLQPAQALRNSDSVRRCDGIFKRCVQIFYNTPHPTLRVDLSLRGQGKKYRLQFLTTGTNSQGLG